MESQSIKRRNIWSQIRRVRMDLLISLFQSMWLWSIQMRLILLQEMRSSMVNCFLLTCNRYCSSSAQQTIGDHQNAWKFKRIIWFRLCVPGAARFKTWKTLSENVIFWNDVQVTRKRCFEWIQWSHDNHAVSRKNHWFSCIQYKIQSE